jgi:anti-sigma factor RsiW
MMEMATPGECAGRALMLNAWIDGELDAAAAREAEAHVAGCAACRAEVDRLRAVSRLVRERAPRPAAPDVLRERIRRMAAQESRPARHAVARPRWLAAAAAAVVVALGAGSGGYLLGARHAAGDAFARDAVASHLRSLQPGRLADVPSSDRHQVKPWFAGRLPFSPPVWDFTAQGFPLAGGRVDYLGGRPVAAIAYHRRLHVVNLYVWPADRDGDVPASADRLGYHLRSWSAGGFRYLAITDAAAADLAELRRLVIAAESSPQPPPTR